MVSFYQNLDSRFQSFIVFIDIFNEYLYTMHPQYEIGSGERPFKTDHSDTSIKVHLNIESNETRITMETDESYKLNIKDSGKEVEIKAT